MSNSPQNQYQNWNQQNPSQGQQSQYLNQHPHAASFPSDPHAVRGAPPFRPGGVIQTQDGYVITRAIKYKTIADRKWSTIAMLLTVLNGIGAVILMGTYDSFTGLMALTATVVMAICTGVVHMLESIVAELRRLG
jgi:hypothetical protein